MPKVAWIACILAFVIAGLGVLSALAGPIISLPLAFIPLMAGVGILRRRAWSAYGFGMYCIAQLVLLPLATFRMANSVAVVATEILLAIPIPIFLLAGRSLTRTGAERGLRWPWFTVTVLISIRLIFLQAFVIPTGAMENTILIGDHILVQKLPKTSPSPGDMFAFIYPVDRRQTFVKRIIGIPGDRIRISNKIVFRNGGALQEPYVVHKNPYPDSYRDNFPSEPTMLLMDSGADMLKNDVVKGEVVVPEGKFFVLGDNRDNSLDSRYWGFISYSDLIGKPILIYDSVDQPTDLLGKPTGPRRIRWARLFKVL